jgi:hypothetical protein
LAENKLIKQDYKEKQKIIKRAYKENRSPLKKRIATALYRAKYPFVVVNVKVGRTIHKKRNAIRELNVKLDYIVNSLKATANTSDEIRAKTIEDIVEAIDDL